MSLTFTERQRIRHERSRWIKSNMAAFNIADLEIREMLSDVLDENEQAALMLSRGASIQETVVSTGCPKCRVEKIRQQVLGKNNAKPRSFYVGLDARVYELREQGLSFEAIGRELGVTNRFVIPAWQREHRRRNESGGVPQADAGGDLEGVA